MDSLSHPVDCDGDFLRALSLLKYQIVLFSNCLGAKEMSTFTSRIAAEKCNRVRQRR